MQDFADIQQLTINGTTSEFNVELNPNSKVYEGHFPNFPVVPGVLLVKLIRDCLELKEDQKFELSEAKNIKFLELVNPKVISQFTIKIDIKEELESALKIKVIASVEDKALFKFDGVFGKRK